MVIVLLFRSAEKSHSFQDLLKCRYLLTHLETIISLFHKAAISDFGERKKWKPIFSESSCIKNIRSKVKLLLTDTSHRCSAFRHSDPHYTTPKEVASKFLWPMESPVLTNLFLTWQRDYLPHLISTTIIYFCIMVHFNTFMAFFFLRLILG